MAEAERPGELGRGAGALGLLGVMLVALGVRALGYEAVFQEGQVVFPPADAQYHLRRALYTYVNFPGVLLFDSYLNHPGGAPIPWPPLFDYLVGATARLLAADEHQFELVAAWAPPLLACATVLPIYLAGCCVRGRAFGLAAGALFALLPVNFQYTALGNADHHAAVAAIGGWLLYLCMALVDSEAGRRRVFGLATGLVAARVAMLLTWHGSLLYLALTESVLLVWAAVSGNRRLSLVHALGAAATALMVAPIVALSPTPLGGDFSSIALSWLHVLAILAVASIAAGSWLIAPILSARGRAGFVAASGTVLGVGMLLHPATWQGLQPALGFLTMADGAGPATAEQQPLFAFFGGSAELDPKRLWGWFAYLLPLAPLGPWLYGRGSSTRSGQRSAVAVLALWVVFFGVLAIAQIRYGNDLAPAASLAFALLLWSVAWRATAWLPIARRVPSLAPSAALLAGVLLILPALRDVFLPAAYGSLAAFRGESWPRESASTSVEATLSRFLREVRLVTPETSSYLAPGPPPEYGIITHPNLGHAVQFRARRPTGADPFWAYIGAENWAHTAAFLRAESEAAALNEARRLRARYLITAPTRDRRSVGAQLHFFDGAESDSSPRLERFRLVTESSRPGHSIFARRRPDPPGATPYKLFEIVPGADVAVNAEAGSAVTAALRLITPAAREFVYRARTVADEQGVAHLRLPYATTGSAPVHSRGPYRIRVGDRSYRLEVPEPAVLEGGSVRLDTLVREDSDLRPELRD